MVVVGCVTPAFRGHGLRDTRAGVGPGKGPPFFTGLAKEARYIEGSTLFITGALQSVRLSFSVERVREQGSTVQYSTVE